MTHLVPNPYGPWRFGPPQWDPNSLVPLDKQSPTNSVPMDRWSSKIWSSWTNGLQPIWFPRQMVHRIFRLSRGTGCGDQEIQGLNLLGTIWPRGPNFWGPFFHGNRICWGPFVQRDQFYRDRWSRETVRQGLEVRGSNGFRTKCIAAGEMLSKKTHKYFTTTKERTSHNTGYKYIIEFKLKPLRRM